MRRLVQRIGFARGDLVDADGQMRDVAGEVGRPEDLRLPAERAAAQPIHLPQPILRHRDAETEIQIGRAGGVDMRNAGTVTQYLDAAADRAGELPRALHDVSPVCDQPIACTAPGVISNVTRTSPGCDQGYLSLSRYFFASESICALAPSSMTRVTLPRTCR